MSPFRRWSDLQRYLDRLDPFRIKLGLEPTRRALERSGNPHHRLKAFHVAGTNGKGSTCAMLASILRAAGYRVGLYTSPHLLDVRERIRVDGAMISREAFLRAAERVRLSLHRPTPMDLTHFEFLTVAAFVHFDSEAVDYAVVETGMGGRLDATNVVEPRAAILTSIGLDHTEWLGHTLEAVAGEKAMIIKRAAAAVAAEPRLSFRRRAARCGVPLIVPREGIEWRYPGGSAVVYRGRRYGMALGGRFYAGNAALALAALEAADMHLPWAAIQRGLSACRWPGRGEWVRLEERDWLLDVAHNAHAMPALRAAYHVRYPRIRPVVVLAMLRTKDAAGALASLRPWAGPMIFTRSADPRRAHDPDRLRSLAVNLGIDAAVESNPARAFRRAERLSPRGDPIVVTGSHTLVACAFRRFHIRPPGAHDKFVR